MRSSLEFAIAVLSLGGCGTTAPPNMYQQAAAQQDTVCLAYGPRMSAKYMQCLERVQDEAEPHLRAAEQAGRDEAQRQASRALFQTGVKMATTPPPPVPVPTDQTIYPCGGAPSNGPCYMPVPVPVQ
jgi:hypothetical protein